MAHRSGLRTGQASRHAGAFEPERLFERDGHDIARAAKDFDRSRLAGSAAPGHRLVAFEHGLQISAQRVSSIPRTHEPAFAARGGARQLQGLFEEITACNGIGERQRERLVPTHRLAGQHHGERSVHTDETGQALGAAATRHHAEPDLGQAEDRVSLADAQMAGHREFEAAAERAPLDRGYDRLRQRVEFE